MRGGVRDVVAPGASRVARARGVWDAFWFTPVDPTPLRWIRACVGAVALFYALELARLLGDFYVAGGLFPMEEARSVARGQWISVLLSSGLDAPIGVAVLYGALLFSLVALVAGWRVRATAPLAYLLLLWFQLRMPLYLDGGDEVLRFALLYLAVVAVVCPGAVGPGAVGRAGREASPEAKDGAAGGTVPVWTLRIFQIQIALMYFLSGYWKVTGAPWWDGSAVWVALTNPSFARFDVPEWMGVRLLFVMVGVAIAWWEFLFPALVASGKSRGGALAFGGAVHLGILLTMNIGLFPLAVLATYPAFMSGDRLRAIGDRFVPATLRTRALPFRGAT